MPSLKFAVREGTLHSVSSEERQVDSGNPQSGGVELSVSGKPLRSSLQATAREIAGELDGQLDELAERWYERMTAIPELAPWSVPGLRPGAIENARRDIGHEISRLRTGRAPPSRCPEEVIESARLGEASGFPLWGCVQAYRTGHAVQWEAWSEAIEGRGLDSDDRVALLRAGSEYMFEYADRCARWVEAEYTRRREKRMRSEEQLRIQLVRDLLEGRGGDGTPLGYQLDGWHIALVAVGAEGDRVLRDLGVRLDAELLSVAADAITWWGWLRPRRMIPGEIDRCLRALTPPAGVMLALGDPCEGPPGFRQTHMQAQHAAAIGARRGAGATLYADVALEALGMADREQARWFVSRELGPLAGQDQRARTLRATLRAYFSAGQNATSAALTLGVHERTIGNRLRATETLLGRPILHRRAELETALRIHALQEQDQPRAKT
jgi:hypothetical protein